MDWFEQLTGFAEQSPTQVRGNLTLVDGRLCSTVNQCCWNVGRLTLPSLMQLRVIEPRLHGRLQVSEWVADVQQLHIQAENAGALFQVASQFNLLEMVSPRVSPEQGVGIYQRDRTQGPACAIAAGAATIYRNYFVELDGQLGQRKARQLNCLADLGDALGNRDGFLWHMQNGYVIPADEQSLEDVAEQLQDASDSEIQQLQGLLRIGLHQNVQVTLNDCQHHVTQALCSALPIAYSAYPAELWADFAQLVLNAAYEATLAAAVQNTAETGNNRVFLTMLGGGAFGNPEGWIIAAIRRALLLYQDAGLNVVIVSHSRSNLRVVAMLDEVKQAVA